MTKIYEIYGTDAHGMTKALLSAAEIAGSIPRGASIALKPNLILAGDPDNGATTHPGVLSGADPQWVRDGRGGRDVGFLRSFLPGRIRRGHGKQRKAAA